jgi:hypothetical protein
MVNGFVVSLVRTELASQAAPDPAQAAAQVARLGELLATGRYPRFAAALAQGGPPVTDLGSQFGRLLDRILDGLIGPAGLPVPVVVPAPVVVPVPAAAEQAADDEKHEDERP